MMRRNHLATTYTAKRVRALIGVLAAGLLIALQAPVIASAVEEDPPADPPSVVATTSLLIKMVAGLSDVDQQAVVARNGGVESSLIEPLRLHVVDVDDTLLAETQQRYASDPQVQRVEVEKTREAQGVPSDTDYGQQWALPQIGWDQAYRNRRTERVGNDRRARHRRRRQPTRSRRASRARLQRVPRLLTDSRPERPRHRDGHDRRCGH